MDENTKYWECSLGAGLAQGSELPARRPRGSRGRQKDALCPENIYFILLKGTPVIALVLSPPVCSPLVLYQSALCVLSGQVSSQHGGLNFETSPTGVRCLRGWGFFFRGIVA